MYSGDISKDTRQVSKEKKRGIRPRTLFTLVDIGLEKLSAEFM